MSSVWKCIRVDPYLSLMQSVKMLHQDFQARREKGFVDADSSVKATRENGFDLKTYLSLKAQSGLSVKGWA